MCENIRWHTHTQVRTPTLLQSILFASRDFIGQNLLLTMLLSLLSLLLFCWPNLAKDLLKIDGIPSMWNSKRSMNMYREQRKSFGSRSCSFMHSIYFTCRVCGTRQHLNCSDNAIRYLLGSFCCCDSFFLSFHSLVAFVFIVYIQYKFISNNLFIRRSAVRRGQINDESNVKQTTDTHNSMYALTKIVNCTRRRFMIDVITAHHQQQSNKWSSKDWNGSQFPDRWASVFYLHIQFDINGDRPDSVCFDYCFDDERQRI